MITVLQPFRPNFLNKLKFDAIGDKETKTSKRGTFDFNTLTN